MFNQLPDSNPIIEMLRQIRTKIHVRMERGELNYTGEHFTLTKHLQIARELKNPRLIGQTHNLIGVIEIRMGHFEAALQHLIQAKALFEEIADTDLLCIVQNNLGEYYRRQGQYEAAIQAYQMALVLATQGLDRTRYVLTHSNLGLAWLGLENYAEAELCFHEVFIHSESDVWLHLPGLVQAYSGMAEVTVRRQDYDSAWDFANEAGRLARGREEVLLLAHSYLGQARVAEADNRYCNIAGDYYLAARDLLQKPGMPVSLLAQTLLTEAQYYQRYQQPDKAVSLAKAARDLFTEMGLTADYQRATDMLEQLPT